MRCGVLGLFGLLRGRQHGARRGLVGAFRGFGFSVKWLLCEVRRSCGAAEAWVRDYGAGSSELSDKDAEKYGLTKSL